MKIALHAFVEVHTFILNICCTGIYSSILHKKVTLSAYCSDFRIYRPGSSRLYFLNHMWDRWLFGNIQNMTSGTIAILEHDIWDSGFYGSTHLGQWVFLNHTSGTVTFLEMFRT